MSEEALLNPEIEPQVEETAPGNDWIQSEQEEEVEEPAAEEQEAPKDNEEDDDEDEEDYNDEPDYNDGEENVYSIKSHKLGESESGSKPKEVTQKKNVRKSKSKRPDVNDIFGRDHAAGQPTYAEPSYSDATEEQEYRERQAAIDKYSDEDPLSRKRRLLEEKMDQAIKVKTVRRKKDEDDIERMQDDKIDYLKDQMIKAANLDVEKNSQGQIATEKLKLLTQVSGILSRADLAISILDNNLLEAVRLWLEPLPDASMPAYQIQKLLIFSLETLPIKTDHLVASGLGKVLVFYQRSKRTEPSLKKIVDRLIGDWTRPILNKSDSYKDRSIQFNDYNKSKFSNKLASARLNRPKEAKTLYEQNAARRNRAAIPSARTAAYKIAPRVDASLIKRQQTRNLGNSDERFKRLNSTLTSMSVKKKTVRKGGPSIEGRNLAL